MKKYILVILLLLSCAVQSSAQGIITGSTQPRRVTWDLGGRIIDSILVIPVRDTVAWTDATFRSLGRITIRPQDSGIYYHRGNKWTAIGSSGPAIDTSSLSNRINLKENSANKSNTVTSSTTLFPNNTAVINYVTGQGYLTSEVDGSVTNELQTISKAGATVTLSNGGGSFTDADTAYTAGSGISISNHIVTNTGVITEVDGSVTNELQTISKAASTITLSNGGGSVVDDTATNYSPGTGISISGRLISNTGIITEVDGSISNELQTISKAGTTVTLSNGGGSFTDADTAYTAGTGISIANHVVSNTGIITEVDGSISNELQTISKSAGTVTLSNGGGSYVDDTLTNYSPGTGISISGRLIANTGDLSNTNEIQTLSKAGSTISLSGSGGSAIDDTVTNYSQGYGIIILDRLVRTDTQSVNGLVTQYDLSQFVPASAPPSGTAGGDLSGTYPNPQIGTGVIVNADINAGAAIAVSKLAFSTISGVTLGNNLSKLQANAPLSFSTSFYDGSTGSTLSIADADVAGGKGASTYNSSDFDVTAGSVQLDYVNGQKATSVAQGYLSSGDWITFNDKVSSSTTSVDNQVARYDLTTGKIIQNSGVIINDAGGLQLPQIQNTIAYATGQVAFDTTCDCYVIDGKTSTTRLNVGQELWENVYNNTGSTITAGQAVYINGGISIASEVFATVALAQANSSATIICIGLATEDIPNATRGKITTNGTVHNINTSGLSVGNVFVSSSVAGGLTNTAPLAPNYRYRVGVVSSVNASTGTIKVTGSTAALGNGTADQLFGMNNAGSAQEVKSIVGTLNRLAVTNTTNTITLNIDPAYVATVSQGGTGVASTTAYGTITGGTTSTGVLQNAGTGTTGQYYKSNGNAALPTWTTPAWTVAQGGTGVVSTTAYGVVLGGTTTTGALQNAGAGLINQVLTSGGASAVSTWTSQPLVHKSGAINSLAAASTAAFTTDPGKGDFVVETITITVLSVTGAPSGTFAANVQHGANVIGTVSISATNGNTVGKKSLGTVSSGVLNVPASTIVNIVVGTPFTVATVHTMRYDLTGHYTN